MDLGRPPEPVSAPPKKRPGRPRKDPSSTTVKAPATKRVVAKKAPSERKVAALPAGLEANAAAVTKRGPGRPKKNTIKEPEDASNTNGVKDGDGAEKQAETSAGGPRAQESQRNQGKPEKQQTETNSGGQGGTGEEQEALDKTSSGREVRKSRKILEMDEYRKDVANIDNLVRARRRLKWEWEGFEANNPPSYVSHYPPPNYYLQPADVLDNSSHIFIRGAEVELACAGMDFGHCGLIVQADSSIYKYPFMSSICSYI